MRIEERLSDEKKQQLRNVTSPKKKQEQLSRKDWEELMGTKRDRYERRNGAVRRK